MFGEKQLDCGRVRVRVRVRVSESRAGPIRRLYHVSAYYHTAHGTPDADTVEPPCRHVGRGLTGRTPGTRMGRRGGEQPAHDKELLT